MGITFAQVSKHLDQKKMWRGLDAFAFEPMLLTVTEVLGCRNCWTQGQQTIREYVRVTGHEALPDTETILAYANDFHDGPVIVFGSTLAVLRTAWPAKYGDTTGDGLVLLDGNHRTCALAIRRHGASRTITRLYFLLAQRRSALATGPPGVGVEHASHA
jgi:hypothetical protein